MAVSNYAMSRLVADSNALSKIISTQSALSSVAGSTTAMNNIFNNRTALSTVVNNTNAMNTISGSSVAMNAVASSTVAIGAIASSTSAKNAVLASHIALDALDRSPLAQTMSSAATVNGRGFVISYSVESYSNDYALGGYEVTIDSVVANLPATNCTGQYNMHKNASDSHKFFTSKIGLKFTIATINGYNSIPYGSMKYILGT